MQFISSIVCDSNVKWIHILRDMLNSLFLFSDQNECSENSGDYLKQPHKEILSYTHLGMHFFFFLFLQRILEFIHHQASGFILLCSLKITFIPFYFLTRLFFPCLSGMPHYHELSKVFLYSFVSFSSWRFTSLQEAWNWRVPQAVGQTKSSPAGHQNRPPSIHSQGGSSWSAFSSLKLLQLIFSPHQVISALMNDTNSQRWLKPDALR